MNEHTHDPGDAKPAHAYMQKRTPRILAITLSIAPAVILAVLMLVLLGPPAHARALAPSAADAPRTLPATPGLTLTGQSGSGFGQAVATAGDINADGYDDALVLSWLNGLFNGWRVNVFHGGAGGLSETPAITFTSEAFTETGRIAPAGDVNNDGYADVLIGSYSDYAPNQGRVYVYHGGTAGLNPAPASTLLGPADTRYGFAIASAGDVNGDGFGDAIVGADAYDGNRGSAYVYLGSSGGLNTTPALSLTGEAQANFFGGAATGAGDVNNDGFDDVAIGALGVGGVQGRVYVYPGGPAGLSATPVVTLSPPAMIFAFGSAVAPAGDVNQDGYDDLLVGTPDGQGRVFLFQGNANGLDGIPAQTLSSEAASSFFGGSAMAPLGDVNNDGYADVILGAGGYANYTGRAYVFVGGLSATGGPQLTPALTLIGVTTDDLFGIAVSGAGDIQNDGRPDFIIGARGVNSNQGQAYVYYVGLGEADVSLTKTASSQLVRPGEWVTFTLTFVNNGPDIATGVVISDVLPSVWTNPSFTSSGATVTQTTGAPYMWQVQDLAVGQGGTITVSAAFAPGFPGMPPFTNRAAISATNDATAVNNSASVTANPFEVNASLVMKNTQR